MERLSERDRVLLGYAYRDPFGNLQHATPSSSHHRNSDVDFADVFGGPPRRPSFYELSRSRAGSFDARSRPRQSSLGLAAEKPVFGEIGSPSRRRNIDDDFYDDIFPGSDSGSSTPRRLDRDPFPSTPGSRVLSPSRPVSAGGSSLPPHPSLSKAKSARGADYPSFGSPTHSAPCKGDDGDSDASSFPYAPNPTRASPGADDQRNSGSSFYRRSPLASQFSRGTTVRSWETFGKGGQYERYAASVENYINSNKFHFSVYRWAGKGVSLRLSSLSKETNEVSRYSRIPEVVIHAADLPSEDEDDDMSTSTGVSNNQIENQGRSILNNIFMEGKHGAGSTIPEDILPESDPNDVSRTSTGNSGFEAPSDHEKAGGGKKDATDNFGGKQPAQRQNFVEHVRTVKPSTGVPVSLDEKMHGCRVKGRVKEFIKIFNVDGSPKRKGVFDGGDRKSKEKDRAKSKVDDYASPSAAEAEKVKAVSTHDEEILGTNSVELNEILKTSGIPSLYMNSDVPVTEDSSERTTSSGSNPASTQENVKASVHNVEESHFEDFDECLVEQLSQEQTENQQADEHQDQIQIANAKIQDWSKGREGNIRSLLSTLQYVLWLESGWKPVPLVDIIEGTAVKRAYQRALLWLHPDKLQQRGAAEHQKYIAQKVFDILQEAWDHFNSISGVY